MSELEDLKIVTTIRERAIVVCTGLIHEGGYWFYQTDVWDLNDGKKLESPVCNTQRGAAEIHYRMVEKYAPPKYIPYFELQMRHH